MVAASSSVVDSTCEANVDDREPNPEFDWKVAVALGGCSFEAYNEPESSNGLPEVTPTASRIVYTDK